MDMKNPEKFRINIDGVWYYKCNCCKQWKIETEFGCDNYCNARHGHTTRCKRCLHIINHYDKGYKVFHIPPFKNGELYCTGCNQYKNIEEFGNYQNAENRNGKKHFCKYCEKKMRDKYYSKLNNEPEKALDKIFKIRLLAAKKRALKKGLEFNIDIDFMHYLWNTQKGLCNISKLPMTFIFNNKHGKYNISIDRIDSTKGYTKDNTQLVCDIVNRMKLDLPMNEFVTLCKIIYDEQNRT